MSVPALSNKNLGKIASFYHPQSGIELNLLTCFLIGPSNLAEFLNCDIIFHCIMITKQSFQSRFEDLGIFALNQTGCTIYFFHSVSVSSMFYGYTRVSYLLYRSINF